MICGPRIRTSPSSPSFSSMFGATWPDRPELDRVGQVHRAAAAALRQAPQLRHRHADRVEELEHRHRRRRGAHVHGLELVEAELPAQLRQHHLVGLRVLLCELVGYRLAGLLQPHLLVADVDRPLQRALALRVLLALDHRVEAGLQLLPDAGHGEEPAGPHLRQVGDHLARVRAAGDGVAQHDRYVVAGRALGDVRHGQVGDDASALGEVDHVLEAANRAHDVVVRDLHALRRSRGAGRVDQGEEVARARPMRASAGSRPRRPRSRAGRRRGSCPPRTRRRPRARRA